MFVVELKGIMFTVSVSWHSFTTAHPTVSFMTYVLFWKGNVAPQVNSFAVLMIMIMCHKMSKCEINASACGCVRVEVTSQVQY